MLNPLDVQPAVPAIRGPIPAIRPAIHRARRLLPLLAALLAIGLVARGAGAAGDPTRSAPSHSPARSPQADSPTDTQTTYALAETWADVPLEARAGRFVAPVDITSAPDGTIFVADLRTRGMRGGGADDQGPPALHILEPDGRPRTLVALRSPVMQAWAVPRLDAGPDGTVVVLGTENGQYGSPQPIVRFDRDGRVIHRFETAQGGRPTDVAVGPDGRIYVTNGGWIEVYTPDGHLDERFGIDALAASFPGIAPSFGVIDVAPDGRVYVEAGGTRSCTAPPQTPRPTPPPAPTRTPRPSLRQSDAGDARSGRAGTAADRPDRPGQPETACDMYGLAVLDSSHGLERFFEGVVNDVAAGADGVYWLNWRSVHQVFPTRQVEIDMAPRTPRQRGQSLFAVEGTLRALDIAADGSLLTVVGSDDAFYTGAFSMGRPAAPRWSALGISDTPAMLGPTYPLRLDAAEEVLVFNAPHQLLRGPRGDVATRTAIDDESNVSAIQRWSADGRLIDQRTHDAALTHFTANALLGGIDGSQIMDIAFDGQSTFAVSEDTVWLRPDPLAPLWHHRFPYGTRFVAAAAEAGQVAALDVRGRRVVFVDRDGALVREWPLGAAGAGGSPSDLALAPDSVYLADQGRNRVAVRGMDGTDLGEWPTHDGPRRVDVGPEGDVYVLGRGGFGLRYTPDGRLVSAWRLPRTHRGVEVEGHDIAVGRDGRVFVAFVGLSDPDLDDRRGWRIDAGGVWVFEPATIEVPPGTRPPGVGGCAATVDKTAAPGIVEQGDAATVTLVVGGTCPGHFTRHDLMIVLDTSWSMTYGQFGVAGSHQSGRMAWGRAKDLLDTVLAALDTDVVKVGLVTFGDGAGLQVPLPGEIGEMRARLAALQPDGDTRMGAGIDLAQRELEGVRGEPGAKRSILVVSDGIFKDDPRPAIQAARAAGIEVAALAITTYEFTPRARADLLGLFGDPAQVFVDPEPAAAAQIIRAISSFVPNPDLFASLTVRDVIPANMRYVPGSASPPAAWDAPTRTLTWTLADIGAAGAALSYQVVPEELGTWPTNVEAELRYRDALGAEGRLVFPIPQVTVVAPSTPARVFLPWAGNRWCRVARAPLDIVLVLDVSSTMGAPAGGGQTTKLAVARAASKSFLTYLDWRRDRVAIVAFDAGAHRLAGFVDDRAAAAAMLDQLAVGLGTRIDLGLAEAGALIEAERRPTVHSAVILLSDGMQNGTEAPVRLEAQRLKAQGASIVTIGLGADAATELLRDIATSPEHAYLSPSTDDLARVYTAIAGGLACQGGA